MIAEDKMKMMQELLANSTELLKEMKNKQVLVDGFESIQNTDKIEETKEDIRESERKISVLKERLSNVNNYKNIDKRTKEALEVDQVWQNHVEVIRQEVMANISKYHKLQAQAKLDLDAYQDELRNLKTIVSEMELKLNHDSIAKKQGLEGKAYFSVDEKVDYVQQMMYFQERIAKIAKLINFLAVTVNMYDAFIEKENLKLKEVNGLINILNNIKSASSNVLAPNTDSYALFSDKTALAKEENILKMLQKQLEQLMYNPWEKMEKQIAENENILKKENENKSLVEEATVEEKNPLNFEKEDTGLLNSLDFENKKEDSNLAPDVDLFSQKDSEPMIEESEIKFQKVSVDDYKLSTEENENSSIEEQPTESENKEHQLEQPSEEMMASLEEENVPVVATSIEDAPQVLRSKKTEGNFLKKWNSWQKQMKAASIVKEVPKITNTVRFDIEDKTKDDSFVKESKTR